MVNGYLGFECVEVGQTVPYADWLFFCLNAKGTSINHQQLARKHCKFWKQIIWKIALILYHYCYVLGKIINQFVKSKKSVQHLHSAMDIIHRISSNDHLKTGKILFEIWISHEIRNELSRSCNYLEQSLEYLCAFSGSQRSDILYKIFLCK